MSRWTQDLTTGAAYLRFSDKAPSARQEVLADGSVADFAGDGSLIGVEMFGFADPELGCSGIVSPSRSPGDHPEVEIQWVAPES